MVGKLGVSGACNSIYLMTSELYPTGIRNFSLGLASDAARIGSIVCPYVADLVGALSFYV